MLIKKSITLKKHRTSLSLEKEFWDLLDLIAKNKNCSLQKLISDIDVKKKSSLASSTRVFVIENLKKFNL
jgi:predicted DNA-binding ribbon-helix-helix protein